MHSAAGLQCTRGQVNSGLISTLKVKVTVEAEGVWTVPRLRSTFHDAKESCFEITAAVQTVSRQLCVLEQVTTRLLCPLRGMRSCVELPVGPLHSDSYMSSSR